MKNLRRTSQALFLLLFAFLLSQTESTGNDELGWPVRIFLDFDPLILVSSALSSRTLASAFMLALITIGLTVILGRVFCGWVCPLGTLNNMVSSLRRGNHRWSGEGWRRAKYLVLVFLLVCAVFTVQLTGLLDPISLLIRSLALGVNPWFNHGLRSAFDSLYEHGPAALVSVSEKIYDALKATVLSFRPPRFHQSTFIAALFLLILGLNLTEKRFWCRNLCPLGGLLGLLSRYSLLKRSVSEGCTECGKCATVCPGGAVPDRREGFLSSECYACWNCDDICPSNAVSFGFTKPAARPALDLGRRRTITAGLAGVAAAPMLLSDPARIAERRDPLLIRPPGSVDEPAFLARCVRCGECMKVCLTNGLQPALFEAGLEGLWTPVLVPTLGYCEFRCTLCGQVCPTGAIRKLNKEEKARTRIGIAMLDKGRCLPWSHARPCIVCEEFCPTPQKAIRLEAATVSDIEGRPVQVQRPVVDLEKCIGCGICEAKCPIEDRPAIYVTRLGESRSKENTIGW